jgi:gas vesicle protein
MTDDKTCTVGALMLVAGGIIGAGLALLYAPQSGQKTRKQINRYAHRVRNDAEEMIRDTADSVADMVEELGDKTSDLIERSGDITEEWRQQLLDTLERGQRGLETQRRKLSHLWGQQK